MQQSHFQLLPLSLLVIIVIYGSLARFSVVENTIVDAPIRADAHDYFLHAKNLALYSIYGIENRTSKSGLQKDAVRAPGFPYFASFFYQGDNMLSVKSLLQAQTILQCIMFTILNIICWQLLGPWFAVLASLLIWTHPSFISINTYYLTESLFLSSIILIAGLFMISEKFQFHWVSMVLLGLAIGVSGLIRPIMNYYCLFIVIIFLLRFRHYLRQFWPVFVTSMAVAFTWKLRNYFSIGYFSDPKLMINALFHGSYPGFMYNNIAESYGFPYRFDPQVDQYYESVYKTLSLIWHRVIQKPVQYLYWYLFGKQLFLWQWDILAGQGDVFIYPTLLSPIIYQADLRFWHDIHHYLNTTIMLIGVLYSYFIVVNKMIKQNPPDFSFFIASLVTFASLFHVIVAPFPRYGIPFKVLVIIVCVMFFKSIFKYLKNKAC